MTPEIALQLANTVETLSWFVGIALLVWAISKL